MRFFAVIVFLSSIASADPSSSYLPNGCEYEKECLQELPGAYCGDGTESYLTLTVRPKAKNVLIFLKGGGACWDFESCTGGFAKSLTRVIPDNDWLFGKGIQDSKSPENPFRDFTVVTVPYCTGDVFGGTRDAEYSSQWGSKKVKHQGYNNVLLTLEHVKKLYPNPEKVAMVGESAGGMGVMFHVRNLVKTYPNVPTYVVSDGGVPFKPPYIKEASYKNVMKSWGAKTDGPTDTLADIVAQNTKNYPNVRFGLIGAYSDYVMTFFAYSLGTQGFLNSVKKTLIDIADNYLGKDKTHQKVFYFDSTKHTYLKKDFKGEQSEGVLLSDWLTALVMDKETGWTNVRPDLNRELTSHRELEKLMSRWTLIHGN